MDLVTGGAGFLGSHLVRALVDHGRNVRVLDGLVRRPNDDGERLREAASRFGARVDFVHADLGDRDVLDQSLVGVERVIHLAHATGSRHAVADPVHTLRTNVLGTQALLDAMERARVDRLVLVSSAQVYGDPGPQASREVDLPAPTNPYGASMVAAEALACAWQSMGRGSVAIVRPTTTYGPRMRPESVVARFAAALEGGRPILLFGTGTSRRDFVHVRDVVRVLLAARQVESRLRPAIFNACTGTPTTLLELVAALRAATGRRGRVECVPSQTGDPATLWADPRETARRLGTAPQVSLQAGLAQTIAWMRRRRSLM